MLAAIPVILAAYFITTLYLIPDNYTDKALDAPSPYLETTLSDTEISLGESFRMQIISENIGDYGDVHIVSVAFPNLIEIKDQIRIVSYNFTHQPNFIEIGDKIGAHYTGGTSTILAEYPSIEAMNRPAEPGKIFELGLKVTPNQTGYFDVYVKSVGVPHINQSSHYPTTGKLDHQDEHVQIHTVRVMP